MDAIIADRLAQQTRSGNWLHGRGLGSGLPKSEELNARLQHVVEHFEIEWLTEDQDHPISTLWKRDDPLATNELLLLGDSLSRMCLVDPGWTREQVLKAKQKNPNNRIGAQFELLALASLEGRGQRVIPLKKDHPGCDAGVTLRNGTQIYISLKNFGASSFETSFRSRAKSVADFLRLEMRRRGLNGTAIIVVATAYPTEADWQALRSAIASFFGLHHAPKFSSIGIWSLYLVGLPGGMTNLHEGYPSYQCTVLAPYHKNEQKNLLDKLYEASVNLERHRKKFPAAAYRGLFVRMSEGASIAACSEWAREFYLARTETRVDFMFLYQISVAEDPTHDTTAITHSIAPIARDATVFPLKNERGAEDHCTATFYVGTCTENPPKLIFSVAPGKSIQDCYLFQHGEIYRRAVIAGDGSMEGHMRIIGDGIIEHSVFSLNGQEAIISGKFPNSNRLMLLT
jgi:hypothetical protein